MYEYNYNYVEPLAMLDELPPEENFSFPWIVLTAQQAIKIAINTLLADLDNLGTGSVAEDVKAFLWRIFLQTLQSQGTAFKLKLISKLKPLFAPAGRAARGGAVGTIELPGIDRPSEEIAIAVPRGIETALEQLLAETAPTAARGSAQPIAPVNTPLRAALGNVSRAPEVETQTAEDVKAALRSQLPLFPTQESEVERFLGSDLIKELGIEFLKAFAQNILNGLKEKIPSGKANSLDRYRQLFAHIPLPDIANNFESDRTFAAMRVAGANPVVIARMTAADDRFPVTEAHYQAAMGTADSLARAMAEGRVYIADYTVFAGALDGTYGTTPQTQKFAYAPLAMFAVPTAAASDRSLVPIAIQCGASPTEHPIITPATGAQIWQMAKTVVQIADANFHEAISHFARTHAFIEALAIATHRQIPPTHQLFKLLVPHFQGTFAINNAAHQFLIAPKGGVNDLLSSTIDNSRVAIVKGFQTWGFNGAMLPRQLKDRGVDDPNTLPIYPYRDDGLLVWEAIHQWVTAYLGLFYSSDADVSSDRDLQTWAAEIVAFDGARLHDFGDLGDGKIATRAYLIDAATTIIFTASAQHAAVNFPQGSIMSYPPAMPTAGYAPATKIATGEVDLLDLLPPLDQAQSQLNLVYLLGSVYFTKLGFYEEGHFTDPRAIDALQAFQLRLQEIDAIVDQRNQTRTPTYDYLKPDKIPQSINI